MGLGSINTLSLAEARDEAAKCRKLLLSAIDPIEARKKSLLKQKLNNAHSITFKACQDAYIKVHKPGWRSEKHANQWESTLNTYACPIFGNINVSDVDTDLIMQCLEPIWHKKTDTASRVRGRIESILDWATARKYRKGENPARWKGHLKQLLPSPNKIKVVKHHKALPYKDINKFMTDLRNQRGIVCKALEFGILTAARTGETIYATWDEVDFSERTWTIPAERMKARKEHRVPLSNQALRVLNEMKAVRQSNYIFPVIGCRRSIAKG